MPLIKTTLTQAFKDALVVSQNKTPDETAELLATAVDDYLRSMTIVVAGIATAGSRRQPRFRRHP